ncbi:MAG: thermonuclease family protein [Rhizobiaceae bacterium]
MLIWIFKRLFFSRKPARRISTPTPVRRVDTHHGNRPRPRPTTSHTPKSKTPVTIIKGRCYVIVGDTIVINRTKIRIAGIDAPELDHPWGVKSKFAVVRMCKGKTVTAVIKPEASYDRLVAKCYLPDGTDIAAELVGQGLALDWATFSGGEYRHLEPFDARKKLWRAAMKQGRKAA